MKKIIVSAVMVLALAGGSVFASTAQNSNTGGSKTTASGSMKSTKRHAKRHAKRHSKSAKSMSSKKTNANSK